MLKKLLFIFLSFLLSFCSNEKDRVSKTKSKNNIDKTEQENIEHESIHQQEWKEHHNNKLTAKLYTSAVDIKIEKTKTVTENIRGNFIVPKFNKSGKVLLFTTESFKGIWFYDLQKEIINQLNKLPGSGYKFELSEKEDLIYFRNKTFSKNKPRAKYTIVEQNIKTKEMNIIYLSKNVLTPPVQIGNEIIFLENDKPKAYNIKTKKIEEKITSTFIYVVNNKLIRFTKDNKETISLNGMKPVSSKYTADKKNIVCLTATKGLLLLDNNGTVLNIYPKAFSLSKLNNSNLVVFTEEEDNGKQIVKSDIYIGFTNSDKKIKIGNLEDSKIFNPVWSGKGNKIAYNTEDGKIKIITLNINTKEEKK